MVASSKYTFSLVILLLFAVSFIVFYGHEKTDKLSGALSLFNIGKQQQQINDSVKNENVLNLEELDLNSLKFLLHGILTERKSLCKNYTIHGRTNMDGGYDICLSGKLRPEPNSCTVMSFGINNEWSFDEALANYSCYVHAYDPSMKMEDHMHSKSIQFHNVGLGKKNEINELGWKMKNLKTVIQEAGLSNKVIDVIKCDAEGAEWPFLEDILENKVNVKQIILEIHSPKKLPTPVTKEDLLYAIKLFSALKRSGYVIGHSYHKYICCGAFSGMFPPEIAEKCCHEVYLYNTKYLD